MYDVVSRLVLDSKKSLKRGALQIPKKFKNATKKN